MRLVYYILISIIFFTSCKSTFTKRHYRPGVFRENIVANNNRHLKSEKVFRKQSKNHSCKIGEQNLNNTNIDSLNTNEPIKESSLFDKQKKSIKRNFKLKTNRFDKKKPHRSRDFTAFSGNDNNDDDLTKTLKLFLILFFVFLLILVPFTFFILKYSYLVFVLVYFVFVGTAVVITLVLLILSIIKLVKFLMKRREAKKLKPKKDTNPNDKFDYFMKWLKISNLIYISLIILGLLLAPNWEYLLEIISLSCLFVELFVSLFL
jgi:hypothetical protein